jgi:rubrerythrin
MAEPNPDAVFVADTVQVAEAVIKLLAANEIAAEVFTDPTRTVSEAVTGVTEVNAGEQFEVRVTDPNNAKKARELLTSAERAAIVRSVQEKRLQRTGTVSVTCDECGKPSEWLAEAMGTTENCPHCGAYLDIPDPDDDWSGVDFGTDEEEEDPKAE